MLQLGHVAQVGVDPVGKGPLLLAEDHVVAVAVLTYIKVNQCIFHIGDDNSRSRQQINLVTTNGYYHCKYEKFILTCFHLNLAILVILSGRSS